MNEYQITFVNGKSELVSAHSSRTFSEGKLLAFRDNDDKIVAEFSWSQARGYKMIGRRDEK